MPPLRLNSPTRLRRDDYCVGQTKHRQGARLSSLRRQANYNKDCQKHWPGRKTMRNETSADGKGASLWQPHACDKTPHREGDGKHSLRVADSASDAQVLAAGLT
eukprot:4885915-Pyramimonas_sp.AAC.2